jgi:hypothetical protein
VEAGAFVKEESMRILIVDGPVPDRESSAGERATVDQIDGLLALGHEVTVCALVDDDDGPRRAESIIRRGAHVAGGAEGGLEHLRAVAKSHQWDAIIAHRPGIALTTTAVLPLRPGAATIYWGHDIHTWRLGAQQAITQDVPRHQLRVNQVSEQHSWNSYDLTVYPTSREADFVSARPESPVRGVAMPYYRLTSDDLVEQVGGLGGRRGCLMVGTYAHPPNRDAVKYAVHEILPTLLERDRDATLTVVGDWPVSLRNQLQRPGVEFLGRVTDSELVALHASHVCLLAPLRFGAGTRRKLVAAMGLGLPVITTSEGARGLLVRDAVPEDGILICDEPKALSDAVIELSSAPALWHDTAATARGSVAEVYSAVEFDRALADVVERSVILHPREE